MAQATTPVTIVVGKDDLADLEKWACNSERSVAELLQEALRHYLEYVRADHADLERRRQGPSSPLAQVMARRAEQRRGPRAQAAE